MHSNNKTQQVIATSSAEAELYAISSTTADAVHLKQLITEIENNIGVSTFDFDKHQPNIVLFCDSSSATSLVQRMGSTKEQNIFNFACCGFRICIKLGNLFFVVFQQKQPSRCIHQDTSSCSSSTTSSRSWPSNRCCQRSGGTQQHLPCH